MPQSSDYDAFERELGYIFHDRAALIAALSHSSLRGHDRTSRSNERLAFLGDAILDLAVAERLYRDPRELSKGTMTAERSMLVKNKNLGSLKIALPLALGNSVPPTAVPESVRATALEAVVGAIYLESGMVVAARVATGLLDKE